MVTLSTLVFAAAPAAIPVTQPATDPLPNTPAPSLRPRQYPALRRQLWRNAHRRPHTSPRVEEPYVCPPDYPPPPAPVNIPPSPAVPFPSPPTPRLRRTVRTETSLRSRYTADIRRLPRSRYSSSPASTSGTRFWSFSEGPTTAPAARIVPPLRKAGGARPPTIKTVPRSPSVHRPPVVVAIDSNFVNRPLRPSYTPTVPRLDPVFNYNQNDGSRIRLVNGRFYRYTLVGNGQGYRSSILPETYTLGKGQFVRQIGSMIGWVYVMTRPAGAMAQQPLPIYRSIPRDVSVSYPPGFLLAFHVFLGIFGLAIAAILTVYSYNYIRLRYHLSLLRHSQRRAIVDNFPPVHGYRNSHSSYFAATAVPDGIHQTAFGFLVTSTHALLTVRGPESGVEEYRGLWAMPGGKFDSDDRYIEETLVREIKEELGLDISGQERFSYSAITSEQSTDNDKFVHNNFLVYYDTPPVIKVPSAEAAKVVNPTWFSRSEMPINDMTPECRIAWEQALPFLPEHRLPPANAGATSDWVRRATDRLSVPAGFSLQCVNNRDGLCVPYAINRCLNLWSTSEEIRNKFKANCPPQGYRPDQVIDTNVYHVALWNGDDCYWERPPTPETKVWLRYAKNGNGRHCDALKPTNPGEDDHDTYIYPNGRNAEYVYQSARGGDEELPPAGGPDTTILPKSTDPSAMQEDSPNQDTNSPYVTTKQPATQPIRQSGLARPLRSALNGLVSAGTALVGNDWGTHYYRFNNTLATTATDIRDYVVTFDSREALFTEVEHELGAAFGVPRDAVQSLVNLLYSNSINDEIIVTPHPHACTIRVDVSIKSGNSNTHRTSTLLDTMRGETFHRSTLMANTRSAKYPERASSLKNDLIACYPHLNMASNVAARVVNFVTTQDDVPGATYLHWYERLISGWLMTSNGDTDRRHADAPWIANANMLFPDAALWDWLNEGVLPAPAYVAGAARLSSPDGLSTYSVLPSRRATPFQTPQVGVAPANNDFRAVLSRLHYPHLGLVPVDTVTPAPGAAVVRERYSVFNSSFADELPPIVILQASPFTGCRNPVPALAYTNPDSWRDAISFMLTNFGGSADFIVAMQNVFRRSAKFFTAEIHELPTMPYERVTNAVPLVANVARRLLTMRIIRPNFTQLHDAGARANMPWLIALRVWNAIPPQGNDLSNVNAIPFLPAINGIFPLAAPWAAAQCEDMFPDPAILGQAGVAETLQTSAYWHQFFANVPMGLVGEPDLQNVIRTMTQTEINALTVWLAMDFYAAFGQIQPAVPAIGAIAPQAAIMIPGAAGDYMMAIETFTGVALPGTFDDVRDLVAAGRYYRRDHSLTVHNLIEVYQYTVPVGCAALRTSRLTATYNDDKAAIQLAARLRHLGGRGMLARFAAIAVQWRCATDTAVCAYSLNAANINHRLGIPNTGSNQMDAQIYRTADRAHLGGMNKYLQDYITAVSGAWASLGYASTLLLEYQGGYTQHTFIPANHFDDARVYEPGLIATADTMSSHLLWRCFHPILVGIMCPGLPLLGGIISKDIPFLGSLSSGITLPWDAWLIKLSTIVEVAGWLRILLLSAGYTIMFRPSYVFAPGRSSPKQEIVRIWEDLDDVPPRLSDSAPWSPTLAQDPYWFYEVPSPLKTVLDTPDFINRRAPFLLPVRIVAHYYYEALTALPFMIPFENAAPAYRTANAAQDTLTLGTLPNFNAATGFRRFRTSMPGMIATFANRYHDVDGGQSEIFQRSIEYFSRMMSNNVTFMRSLRGFSGNGGLFVQIYNARNQAIVGPNGNAMAAGYAVGAAAGARRTVESCWTTGCFWRPALANMPAVLPLDQEDSTDNPHLRTFFNIWSTMNARVRQWYFQPVVEQPPILLGDMSPGLLPSITHTFDPTSNDEHGQPALMTNRFIDSVSAAMGAVDQGSTLDPASREIALTQPEILAKSYHNDTRDEAVSFNRPEVVPVSTGDYQHFVSGMRASTSHSNDDHYSAPRIHFNPPLATSQSGYTTSRIQELRDELEVSKLMAEIADYKAKINIEPVVDIIPPATSKYPQESKLRYGPSPVMEDRHEYERAASARSTLGDSTLRKRSGF